MPARKPEEIHPLFAQAFNSGNADAVLALYESGAAMVPAPGQVVTGKEGLRSALAGFLATRGKIDISTESVVSAGDLAVLHARWNLTGMGPDGKPLSMSGRSTEVVRRQRDGTWLYVVDIPDDSAG